MTEWEYRLLGDHPDRADAGGVGLVRLPVGGPVSLAELVWPDGEWRVTDRLWRITYEGADGRVTPIDTERAEQLLLRWVSTGRIATLPSGESSLTAAERARLVEADRQAAAAWRQVSPPPGLDSITF